MNPIEQSCEERIDKVSREVLRLVEQMQRVESYCWVEEEEPCLLDFYS